MDVKVLLEKQGIIPDPLKDQFFLWDEEIIKQIVEFAKLDKNDVVLEVGAGIGNLTAEIAKKVGRVIAFEVDERFEPLLSNLPENVELHFENAWEYIQLHGKFKKKKEYNKVVSNLPYSFVEQFLHNLTFLEYDKVILLIPLKMVAKIEKSGVFGSFFTPKTLLVVPKEKFFPVPKTNSVVVELMKLPDPVKNKNLGLFLRQYIYQHEGQLVKNSLTEGLIKYNRLVFSKMITKNEARELINKAEISRELLEDSPNSTQIYEEIGSKFLS